MADAPKHDVKHEGTLIRIGGRELVMPKLTIGLLKRHWGKVSALNRRLSDASGMDVLDVLPEVAAGQAELIHLALKRNYPELTLEEVEDELEPREVMELFKQLAILTHLASDKASGLQESAPGEATSPH